MADSAHRAPLLLLLVFLPLALAACGGGGGSSRPVVLPNQAPIASAGADQAVTELEPVTLDGRASSDPDGVPVSYRWEQTSGPPVVLEGASSSLAQFTAPDVNDRTELVFILTVRDADGADDTDSVAITVSPPVAPMRFDISGTIKATEGLAVDGDLNDPFAEYTANDTPGTAQTIGNPVTLGGYINEPGSGEQGRSFTSGDLDDYFRVELVGGQTVTMIVADFDVADADLYLMDLQGNVIDFSIESGEIETLVVPQDGIYLVNAFAFAGATNYTLAIGTSNSAAPQLARPEIISGEAIVRYRAGDDSVRLQAQAERVAGRMGMQLLRGQRSRAHLARMQRIADDSLQQRQRLRHARHKLGAISDERTRARWQTLLTIKALRREPDVALAEPNYLLKPLAIPTDDAFSFQWHYNLANLPAAWDLTTGSPEVIVAVVDTGVLQGHPDLQGQLVAGYDFISNPARADDGNGIDANPEDPGGGTLGSTGFHGTHVTGTVAAATNNGRGVAGVAWQARVMPLRALGGDGGTSYDVAQAIRYAGGLPNDSGTVPAQRADIINLSLGGESFSQFTQQLFNQLRQAGVMVVAAAGNEASDRPGYPAAYDNVISVGAVDIRRQLAPYSNFGTTVDVVAPGGDNSQDVNGDGYPDGVLSTAGVVNDSGTVEYAYVFQVGTSMASPHVAGVLALMKAVNPQLGPADIDALLARGELTDDLGSSGRDNVYGHGLLNAQRAVGAALSAAGTPPADNPRLASSTSALSFSSSVTARDLQLQNGGLGELQLEEVATSAAWLAIEATTVDDQGLGSYRVTVDRSGLAPGVYSAQITARSSVNTLTIEVIMTVSSGLASGDVGYLYVLLIDTLTGELAAQWNGPASDGQYRFSFSDIAAGEYEIFAGSDADNDLLICDAGEACSAYLTLDQPITITLDQPLSGLDFTVEYVVSLPNVNALGAGSAVVTARRRSH